MEGHAQAPQTNALPSREKRQTLNHAVSSDESLDCEGGGSNTSTLDGFPNGTGSGSDLGGSKGTLDFQPKRFLPSDLKKVGKLPPFVMGPGKVLPRNHPHVFSTLQRQQKTQSVLGLKGMNSPGAEPKREAQNTLGLKESALSRTQSLRDISENEGQEENSKAPIAPKPAWTTNKLKSVQEEKRWSNVENSTGNQDFVVRKPIQPLKPPRAVVRPVAAPRNSKGQETAPQPDVASPINKTTLLDLYQRLDSSVSDIKQMRCHSNSSFIKLSDVVQKFKMMCSVYAENISPHSKFRFRELLGQLEGYVPRLRACASSQSPELQDAVLKELEVSFRDLMLLIQR